MTQPPSTFPTKVTICAQIKFGQKTTYSEASPRTSPPAESIFRYFLGISGHFREHDAGEVRAAQRLSPVAERLPSGRFV